ncbi:hypothetical protein KAI65_03920 [Candidatus Parcubacteria bacterium]|nr:hypothetical protein [Candidatus Parcubacteria bacterium]
MKKILIHKDTRGVIYRIEIGGVYFNLMTRKKGTLLSGDFHPYTQYDLVLKGEFKITLHKNKKDEIVKKKTNEFISIPPNTPHLFESLTDTITIEWWDGPFEQKIYKPYRKLVDENIKTFNDQ